VAALPHRVLRCHGGDLAGAGEIRHSRPDGSPFPAAQCPLLRPRLTGETLHLEHDWFVRKDGTQVAVSYSSAPVDLTGGRGAVVAFRDISDRLRLGEVQASREHYAGASSSWISTT
jgi:hypothetical protein